MPLSQESWKTHTVPTSRALKPERVGDRKGATRLFPRVDPGPLLADLFQAVKSKVQVCLYLRAPAGATHFLFSPN